MISNKLKKYLLENKVPHEILPHRQVYTAFDAAQTLRLKLDEVVKNLVVKAGKDYYLVLLPANKNLDLKKIVKVLSKYKQRVKVVKIPGEEVMRKVLKLKKEALSAFGKMHQIKTVLEKDLLKKKKAIFSGGSFIDSVKMAVKDFVALEQPIVGSFGMAKKKVKKVPIKKVAKKLKKKKSG